MQEQKKQPHTHAKGQRNLLGATPRTLKFVLKSDKKLPAERATVVPPPRTVTIGI